MPRVFFLVLVLLAAVALFSACLPTHHERFVADDSVRTEIDALRRDIFHILNEKERRVLSGVTIEAGPKSFTENKKRIVLCMRDSDGRMYGHNSLLYVLMHEVAHALNENELHHTERFQRTLDDLVKRAVDARLFDDRLPFATNYCV